jgi:lipopolysaccharide/colanic/teichoic acid biosynthesis glycosyltransferase
VFFFEQKLIKMNLHSNVAESVIVLRSKTKRTKKLLYLIGFEDEFVSNILNENEEVSYEIIQKHQLKEVSIQSLIELNLSNAPEFALICDLNILRKNNFQFLSRVRKETTLQSVPFIVINRTSDSIDLKTAIKKGIDDCYELPLKWENILSRIEFLIQHKVKVQKIGNLNYSNYKIPLEKRIFDVFVATFALIFLSPILLMISVGIKLSSKGPVLYISKRVGTNYNIFDFFKFRSMCIDADQKLDQFEHLNQYNKRIKGPSFSKFQDDPRVTSIGKFLRKTSLDELPQLLNVLRGDMSIIGNRPLPLYEAEQLTTDRNSRRFIAPAGLTGLWQVSKRGKKDMSVKDRIDLDLEYASNHSLIMDIEIVVKTLPAMIQEESV